MAHCFLNRNFWLFCAQRAATRRTSRVWAECASRFGFPHIRQVIASPILLIDIDPVVHPWPCLKLFRAGVPFHHDEIACLLQQTLER